MPTNSGARNHLSAPLSSDYAIQGHAKIMINRSSEGNKKQLSKLKRQFAIMLPCNGVNVLIHSSS